MAKTLFDKLWEQHEVSDGLIYIDLHLVHEITSAQAFEGLRLEGRKIRRPDKTIATVHLDTELEGVNRVRTDPAVTERTGPKSLVAETAWLTLSLTPSAFGSLAAPRCTRKPRLSGAFSDAGGGTRTPDTRIMIPLL